jgi:guanylate kinase
MPQGCLFLISAPSGAGQTSLVKALLQAAHTSYAGEGLCVSVSYTTRAMRPGERDGVEYRFVSREEFSGLVADGQLLEHAEFAGNCYGTPRVPVEQHLDAGTPALLEIELQGARQVREQMPDAFLVFLAAPSRGEQEPRLAGRGTESPEVVADRLARARVEMAAEAEFDAVVVNDDIGRAAAELVALIEAARVN